MLALLTISLVSAQSLWGSDQLPPQINVSGSAEVKVAPDEVDLRVGVETRDADLQVAQRKNDEHMAAALGFLKQQGIPEKDCQMGFVSIQPRYDYDNSSSLTARTQPLYYSVRKEIGIRLTNVVTFNAVLTGLLANGMNSVGSIDFRTSELRKYKDQARAMAIKAAKEKAEAMASELGVKVGKPYNITVNDWDGWSGWSQQNALGFGGGGGAGSALQNSSQDAGGGGGGETGPTFAVGQISISATVNVIFLLR
jgi:hypothetical protein